MAVRPRGKLRTLGIGSEIVYGTAAQPSIWIPGECDLKVDPPFKAAEYPIGTLEDARDEITNPIPEGSLKLECAPGRMEEILLLLDPIAGETVLYGSITVWEGLGNGEWRVTTGVVCSKFALDITKNEKALISCDVVAQKRVDSTAISNFSAPTPDYSDAAAPFIYKEFAAKTGAIPVSEPHIWTMKLEVDFNLDKENFRSDGTGLIAHPPSNGRKLTLTVDHLYEHKDLYTAAFAGTEIAWVFTLTRGTDVLTLTIPRTKIIGDPEPDRQDTKQNLKLEGRLPWVTDAWGELFTLVES